MKRASDSNPLIRGFFIHCYIHIIRILNAVDTTSVFYAPRFELFKKLKRKYKSGNNSLFKNILITYKREILVGALITCIYVFFNMLVPELIKMFMHYLHGHHAEKKEVRKGENFIQLLVGVQVLRVMFGEHTRRIFHELAIKVESSLSRMLVVKSLNLTQKARKDIPQSEILHLENVDLKLVWVMFNNMYFIFEAPLTIIVALIMLFVENPAYGFIGGYWFLIAFLLHREIDENMTHCNATKLGLIEQRAKMNYEILDGIKQAKIIGWEDMIIQKNNDLFQVENHDHELFYFFNSLYDIILLMLPILVVVTIALWDFGEDKHISVEQVYLMLSLLGLCYEPMKEFRTISISFHDGLHSLNRLQQFFDMPEQEIEKNLSNDIESGSLVIEKGTSAMYPQTIFDFYIKSNFHIEVNPGERLLMIGRKGQGRSSFINMINGFMTIIEGKVRMNGQIAYLAEDHFFMKSRVRDNIAFYNENISPSEIESVCERLGLIHDLRKIGGIDAMMEDQNLFTKSQLQRISLARILCSSANIYIMDSPYEHLDRDHEQVLENMLREKQEQEKVTVIMASSYLDFISMEDKVAIIGHGTIKEYGVYQELFKDIKSSIEHYFRSKEDLEEKMSSICKSPRSNALDKVHKVVGKVIAQNNSVNVFQSVLEQNQGPDKDMKTVFRNILQAKMSQYRAQKENNDRLSFREDLKEYIFCVPIVEILFIMLIIACAELLHVFIHFWIGHLEEEHGGNSYLAFRNMIIIEVILTLGLAGVLYYEGEVSSKIAIMQGNSIYKASLSSLIKKRISWFASEYSVKIADRFNHDYEEVFIACHSLLGIYKNFIILIVTVFFISSDGFTVLVIFLIIAALYSSVFLMFRKIEKKIVKHYYDFKYGFVKCFEESLEGADYFRVFGSKSMIVKRAEGKYQKLAAYKQAERYTNHGLAIVCDFMSNLLLATVVYYGMETSIHNNRSNLALIATSIHLLMNGSQVLKNIVKETISFETYFLINLVPFLEMNNKNISQKDEPCERIERKISPASHDIVFDKILLKEPGEISANVPLSLRIKEGERMLIFQKNDGFRNLILYALTQNLGMIMSPEWYMSEGVIKIGGVDLRAIEREWIIKNVGVIMNKNFYISGTLRENLVRKIHANDEEVEKLVRELRIDEDIEDYDIHGLDSNIHFVQSKVNYELTKKFALIRILLNKSKIVIVKDTTGFLGSINIIEMIKKHMPDSTVIKLSNKIESAVYSSSIIYLQNGILFEQGTPEELANSEVSEIGKRLKNSNLQGYLFMNQVSRAQVSRKAKKKISLASILAGLKV